jgi:polyisoprenoid-binding protein YceI
MQASLRACVLAAAAMLTIGASLADVAWTPDLVHSRAEFTVSHMVLSKVWGHVPIRSITLETTTSSVIPTHIDALLDVTHEDTDNHDRDQDLRSETYFDIEHYPTMSFHSTRIIPHPPDDADVTGDITIKNVTKTVTFPIHVVGRIPDSGGTRVGYTGQFHIDRRDFGIVDNRLTAAGVLLVGYDVTIGLTVEATSPDTSFLKDTAKTAPSTK